MRRFLQKILFKPVLRATAKFASKPDRQKIFSALDKLYKSILENSGKKGLVIPFEKDTGKFIIFSDQHKGARNGADDFILSEANYLAALDHYDRNGYTLIGLGDCEELWENTLTQVVKHNKACFDAEKKFAERAGFVKIFGNHDLFWDNDPIAWWQLKRIFGQDVKIYEGVVLSVSIGATPLNIFCAHGHQGDARSDGNWFSKFFVARIWAPLQAYLRINPNTPAFNKEKKTLHNDIMYEWSSQQKDLLLITGHTHQPVFASLTHLERLYKKYQFASNNNNPEQVAALQAEIRLIEREFTAVALDYMKMQPYYFNSGCCCFNDGDITGIEIADGTIRLIKWIKKEERSQRELLESITLEELVRKI
ncbi:MAG: metallophosphoesterase [Chitinophagaceae bacterium]|nr:metallophosphoesterase [Chitinophagaceae bacterium]